MNHCTMSGNRVPSGRYGGAIEVRDSLTTVIINNSILYQNWNGSNNQDVFAQGILEIYYSCLQNIHYSEHFYDTWVDENNIYEDPQFCFPGNFTIAESSPCVEEAEDGGNMGALGIGCEALSSDETPSLTPINYVLHQNYPNPFNPTTSIKYELPENAFVSIRIYDLKGRLVTTLINQEQTAGYKAIMWAGVDDKGKAISACVYLYEIQAGSFRKVKKMILLK